MASRVLASLAVALLTQQAASQLDQKVLDTDACPDYTLYAAYPQYVAKTRAALGIPMPQNTNL